MLYTAQYRYTGQDRIDITVKGNHIVCKYFAPTWGMVTEWKRTGDEKTYTKLYYDLLISRYEADPKAKEVMINMVELFGGENDRDITVVCFCAANTFCHRYLLVKFLQHNYAVSYGGER